MPAVKISLKGYNGGMVLRRTPHAVYDTLYHLGWSPKYRRDVLQGEGQQRVRERCADIAEPYDMGVDHILTVQEGNKFDLPSPTCSLHGMS